MCLNLEKAIQDVAVEEIVVYKYLIDICDGVGLSPIRRFAWHKNKLVEVELRRTVDYDANYVISQGLHAFISSWKFYKTRHKAIKKTDYIDSSARMCEFVIPVGAEYFINKKDGDIVSNKMYWTGRYRTKMFKWVDVNN
jgi:hypothetical protein